MEKVELSKLLIKDSEYYRKNATYVSFLKRHNITTINQLLDSNFNIDSFNGRNLPNYSRAELRCFISMLKYKYLSEPLHQDVYLDRCIDLEKANGSSINWLIPFVKEDGKRDVVWFSPLFGCRNEEIIPIFKEFVSKMIEIRDDKKQHNQPVKDVKLIEFLKWIMSNGDRFNYLIPYVKSYIEIYEKNEKLKNGDSDTISFLKAQLESLVKTRDELDIQVANLQQKIEILSTSETKGGMKK